VTAGLAPESGDVKESPEERKRSGDVLGRDPLQVRIATPGTACVERIAEGDGAGVEARLAAEATPGVNSKKAEDIVHSGVASRAPHVLVLADWAVHLGDGRPFGFGASIG